MPREGARLTLAALTPATGTETSEAEAEECHRGGFGDGGCDLRHGEVISVAVLTRERKVGINTAKNSLENKRARSRRRATEDWKYGVGLEVLDG